MAMLLPDLVKFCNAAPFSRVFPAEQDIKLVQKSN